MAFLRGANLSLANLAGANLSGAILKSTHSGGGTVDRHTGGAILTKGGSNPSLLMMSTPLL